MSTEDNEQSPFTRPGFIIAAIVVAIIVVLAIVLGVVNATRDDKPDPAPSSSSAPTSAAPSTEPSTDAGGASVCGLQGVETSGRLTSAPEVDSWEYQDVYSYPVSSTAGPAETAPEGYRFCYQHTPEGAVFAAANATITAFSPDIQPSWLDYALSEGAYREQLLSEAASSGGEDVRAAIVGFRLLAYNGDTARVDIAFDGSAQGQVVTGSVVYELIWANGDWKLDASVPEPARITQIPDTSGYVSWNEG